MTVLDRVSRSLVGQARIFRISGELLNIIGALAFSEGEIMHPFHQLDRLSAQVAL